MSLSQQQRYYLHAMGIQPWRERSVVDEINETIVTDQESTAITEKNSAPILEKTIKPSAPLKSVLTPSTPKMVNAEQPIQKSETVATQTPVFRLGFVAFDDVLVVTDLLLHETETFQTNQLTLIFNIYRALGFKVSSTPQTMVFAWPLIANAKMNQDEAMAFETVQAQFKKQQQKYKSKFTIVMGATACRYIIGLESQFDILRGQLIANEQLVAAVTYSVNELLKIPALKLNAWQDLQVIRQL